MNARLVARFGRGLARTERRLRQAFHIPVRHRYGNFSILLPAEHLLPQYQRQYPRYDRFLPHLVAALGPDAVIVDVGANCGDTLAGMVERNPRATYVCIEPDGDFFAFLKQNIARMTSAMGPPTVHLVQSLVGKSVGDVTLAGQGGSRHAVLVNEAQGCHSSVTLDGILATLPPLSVRLLKSDVDGFDFDVLDSAEGLLRSQHPILFFETQCDNHDQLSGFIRTMASLETLGYRHWAVFDNFGTLVIRGSDGDVVVQLLDYVWKQNQGTASRTIFYFDILACTDTDSALIKQVIDEF